MVPSLGRVEVWVHGVLLAQYILLITTYLLHRGACRQRVYSVLKAQQLQGHSCVHVPGMKEEPSPTPTLEKPEERKKPTTQDKVLYIRRHCQREAAC